MSKVITDGLYITGMHKGSWKTMPFRFYLAVQIRKRRIVYRTILG